MTTRMFSDDNSFKKKCITYLEKKTERYKEKKPNKNWKNLKLFTVHLPVRALQYTCTFVSIMWIGCIVWAPSDAKIALSRRFA